MLKFPSPCGELVWKVIRGFVGSVFLSILSFRPLAGNWFGKSK